ncbi:MAG: ribulose-phosphate 3-epimerase [Chloroflexi bacterium]|nr:ribulose-phosphate 3-epimerase [Chloroflexota bacterium]
MKLAASILAADFAHLARDVQRVEATVDLLHLDVMDGHFVPNLTFGPPVANALRRHTSLPFAIHLMIERPVQYAREFRVGRADSITVHVEAADPPERALRAVHDLGCKAGISLRPGTPLGEVFPYLDRVDLVLVMSVEPGFGGQAFLPEALDRIRALRQEIGDRPVEIAVDGGIGPENVRGVVEAGADVIVAGSAVFGSADPAAAARELWARARRTRGS